MHTGEIWGYMHNTSQEQAEEETPVRGRAASRRGATGKKSGPAKKGKGGGDSTKGLIVGLVAVVAEAGVVPLGPGRAGLEFTERHAADGRRWLFVVNHTDEDVVVPVTGHDLVADADFPGVVAGRDDPLAVPECRAPAYDEWLVGLGATARYATTLELVNPDDGEAVVDVALSDADGPVEEPALRGIQVPAHGVHRIDLAASAPRRELTAAHVTVTRGRVTLTARTTRDQLGRGRVTTDFLPTQAVPDTDNLILGLPAGARGASLLVANPGDDEVRARVRLVTAEATFTPTDAPEVAVGPHAMQEVDLGPLLSGDNGTGVVGLVVESEDPVVASVRLVSRKDLVLLAPAIEVREPTAAVLPTGEKTLLLGHALRTGVVHVTSYDADGTVLREDQVEVAPDRAASLALPPEAVLVAVEPRNTRIAGVVSMPTGGAQPGLATLRLRPAETHARIPVVSPD